MNAFSTFASNIPSVDLSEIARAAISRVEVDTAYGPSIKLDDPFAPGPPNPYMQRLQPRIRLYWRGEGVEPLKIAPYGDPGPTKWPLVQAALVGAGFIVVGGMLWRLLR